jgi:hypothetical protein
MLRRLLWSCSLLLASVPLSAQRDPLLVFVGTAQSGHGGGGEQTWLVNAANDGLAEPLGPGRIGVCDVFDDDWLVCRDGWPLTHYVLLARRPGIDGRHERRTLVPGGYCELVPQFVDAQHRRVYVLSPKWDDRRGSLRVFDSERPTAGRELLDRVQAVVARSLDGLYVLRDPAVTEAPDAANERELWFVPRQPGGARRVLDAKLSTGANHLAGDAAFSPDHRHLAIGHHAADGTGGAIWIIDLIAGRLVAQLSGIPLAVAPESSDLPTVLLAWQDAATLRYSRTAADGFEWVTWSLGRREEVAAERYGEGGLCHERPPAPGTAHPDALRVDDVGIWFAGTAGGTPAADAPVVARPTEGWWVHGSKLQVGPDRCHAVWFHGGELRVIDGVRRQTRVVYRGTFDFWCWLPDGD